MFQPNGISLHVEDHGSGKPVVLLHGCSPLATCRGEFPNGSSQRLVERETQ